MKRFICLALLVSCCLLMACSTQKKVAVNFEPGQPIRVMVLPFVQLDDSGKVIQQDASIILDGVPLVSEKLEQDPPELLRQMVQSELAGGSLDILPPVLVNLELPHHDFGRPDGSFDLQKIYSTPAKDLCQHFLDCDAVLYGTVTDWDRSYYGVQTVNSVGLKLKLVLAKDNRTLYEVEVKDSEGRGISGGPTGFSDLVVEPLKGLDSDVIADVARAVTRQAVEPLIVKSEEAPAMSTAPALYAVAHTVLSEKNEKSKSILVLAFASPGCRVSFSLSDDIQNFPMVEVEPGQYMGQYIPQESDVFKQSEIATVITDAFGRTSRQISASGYLNYP